MLFYKIILLILFVLVLFFYRPQVDEKLFSYLGYLESCSEDDKRREESAGEGES